EDDTFIIDIKRTDELADELIKRGNKLPFDSNCRADTKADVEFFKKLKQAGARLFCVGFESGDDEVLKHIKKNLNLSRTHQFMKNTQDAGIMVHGCFMVGNLNETNQTLQKTLDLALDLNPDTAQFFPIMVYPGTAAYNEAKAKGYLSSENFSDWLTEDGLHNSTINLPNMTHKELVEFCDYARKKFYLRPSYLAKKMVQSIKDPDEFKRNLKGFKKLSQYLIKGSFGTEK
ncbi:MAG: B12-binding domain-containing radical SAM protein, partial [Pseudobdellovibrio sp.]